MRETASWHYLRPYELFLLCGINFCLIPVIKMNNGLTPFHTACFGGHKDVVQYMVERAHCDTSECDDPVSNSVLVT